MAPVVQSVSDFVNDRVTNGYSGALTLDERRRRMRQGSEHVRNSVSPRPRRSDLHRQNSSKSTAPSVTSFDEQRRISYHRGDRWDTDTEHLDDTSTVGSRTSMLGGHHLKIHETGSLHDFAGSPAPDGYSASEISGTEEEDDRTSTSASVRTEPLVHSQSLNGVLSGRGKANWATTGVVRPRPGASLRDSLNQLNGHPAQQHQFSRESMVGASLPYHTKPTSHSSSLRPREQSAPPSSNPRSRAFSPMARREGAGFGAMTHGLQTGAVSSYPLNGDLKTPPIVEDGEFPDDGVYGKARQVSIQHAHSFSSMSQQSLLSRKASLNDARGSGGRFRTRRSHVTLRRRNRNNTETELDYSPKELCKMTFQQLAEEDFDAGPPRKQIANPGNIDWPENVKSLEQKCDHMRQLPDHRNTAAIDAGAKSAQETFFASLSIDDYDEAGDFIVGQLAAVVDRLRKVRQAKRKAALDFEDEVAKREQAVTSRMEGLQKELMRLKRSGQEALTAAIASSSA